MEKEVQEIENGLTQAPEKSTPSPLPKAVAKHFDLVDWVGGHRQNFGRFGNIDLKTLTLDQAKRLAKAGFSKLKAKGK
jgi:hypothetical protein